MKFDIITFSELEQSKNRITALLFNKNEFDIESIIRWLMDRKFLFECFAENDNFYIVEQPPKSNYECFEYRTIDAKSIYAQLGTIKSVGFNLENDYEF